MTEESATDTRIARMPVAERIDRGHAWLTENPPISICLTGVRLDRLDVGDPCECVLSGAAEYDSYWTAVRMLFDVQCGETVPLVVPGEWETQGRWLYAHGFCPETADTVQCSGADFSDDSQALTDAWRERLTADRQRDGEVG